MSRTDTDRRDVVATTNASFGQRMRDARMRAGINQKDFATLMNREFDLGWHQTTVGRIESNVREVRLHEAVAIALLLGVDFDELVFGYDNPLRPITPPEPGGREIRAVIESVYDLVAALPPGHALQPSVRRLAQSLTTEEK